MFMYIESQQAIKSKNMISFVLNVVIVVINSTIVIIVSQSIFIKYIARKI